MSLVKIRSIINEIMSCYIAVILLFIILENGIIDQNNQTNKQINKHTPLEFLTLGKGG